MSVLPQQRQALIDGLASTTLHLAEHGLYSREDYGFTSFKGETTTKLSADVAFFDSPIPSIDSATLGVFFDPEFDKESERILDYSYLGAPLILVDDSKSITLYKLEGLNDFHIVEEIKSNSFNKDWQRLDLDSYISQNRGSLQFERSKSLIIQAAKSALLDRMNALLQIIIEDGVYGAEDAFEVAMLSIRFLSLGDSSTAFTGSDAAKTEYSRNIAKRIQGVTSFDNLPPESIAEMYEAFAVTKDLKKRNGIVYTPAWLAKYLVSRIPKEAFSSHYVATDPSCGSGTFLVAYLERFLTEAAHRRSIDVDNLSKIVKGLDIDPVAVELTKLTLDFLAKSLGAPLQSWNISCTDSTQSDIESEWIIGNLPFGYRSYEGKDDTSNRIISRIFNGSHKPKGVCLILPDSLAYNNLAKFSREIIRKNIQIEEIIRLPENTFDTASARTIAIVGRAGESSPEVVVRNISAEDIYRFQMNLYSSKSYVSRLPNDLDEVWIFSPFNNVISKAQQKGRMLSEIAEVMVGMQIYGREDIAKARGENGKPFLEEPKLFSLWSSRSITNLPRVIPAKDNFRRTGPWDKCDRPKIIIRSTTSPENDGRLSAIPDDQGIWFSDKFTGVWLTELAIEEGISVEALAAYFQSRFARVWFSINNPSRKLRTSTLKQLPIPKLPKTVWERTSRLVKINSVAQPKKHRPNLLFADSNYSSITDWEWFNAAVEAAFNIGTSDSIAISKWLERMK